MNNTKFEDQFPDNLGMVKYNDLLKILATEQARQNKQTDGTAKNRKFEERKHKKQIHEEERKRKKEAHEEERKHKKQADEERKRKKLEAIENKKQENVKKDLKKTPSKRSENNQSEVNVTGIFVHTQKDFLN